MNSTHLGTNETILDGWPILLAFALYLLAFAIVAMTIGSGAMVA